MVRPASATARASATASGSPRASATPVCSCSSRRSRPVRRCSSPRTSSRTRPRFEHLGARGIGHPGRSERADGGDVAQAAARFLQVGLEQEGHLAVRACRARRRLRRAPAAAWRPWPASGPASCAMQLGGQRGVAGDVTGVEQAHGGFEVFVGDGRRPRGWCGRCGRGRSRCPTPDTRSGRRSPRCFAALLASRRLPSWTSTRSRSEPRAGSCRP